MRTEKTTAEGRMERAFSACRARGQKALAVYLMAGDPDPEVSLELMRAAARGGATLLELGVPCADPAADGPVIRRAGRRALDHQVNLAAVFAMAKQIRSEFPDLPLVLMLYYNLVYRYGVDGFFDACRAAGVDGCIVPDLPLEEQDEILEPAHAAGIRVVQLASPLSGERIPRICGRAEGFLYCVSAPGTTGERSGVPEGLPVFLDRLADETRIPRMVGFGVSRPRQAAEMAAHADGVIVGSALIHRIEQNLDDGHDAVRLAADMESAVREFVTELSGEVTP